MGNDARKAPRQNRANFLYLFSALLIFTIVAPVMAVSLPTIGGLFAEVSLSLTLVIALWSLRATRPVFVAGLVLIAVNIVATVVSMLGDQEVGGIAAHMSGLVFLVLAAVVAVRAIFLPGSVDLNKVTGSLCVYLLIGIAWAELYQLLHAYDPGSFAGVAAATGTCAVLALPLFQLRHPDDARLWRRAAADHLRPDPDGDGDGHRSVLPGGSRRCTGQRVLE